MDEVKTEPLTQVAEPASPRVKAPELTQVPGGVPDLESTPRELLPHSPEGLRVRLQPTMYDSRTGNHVVWDGVRWAIIFGSVEQVQEFRNALDDFMRIWVDQQQTPD